VLSLGRAERRRSERKQNKLKKEVLKLTPNQTILFDELLQQKTDEVLDVYKALVDDAVFQTLRANRISEERANKIMSEANELIKKKVLEEV
jgi:hypothetical protein